MWKDEKKNAKGHSLYPETIDAIENLLANLHGDWVAEIAVASGGTNEIFYLMAADREVNWDDVDWGEGISVICVMRYGSEGDEKESAYEMMATFQMDGTGDNYGYVACVGRGESLFKRADGSKYSGLTEN